TLPSWHGCRINRFPPATESSQTLPAPDSSILMKTRLLPFLALTLMTHAQTVPARQAGRANPILPGYYADPSHVLADGKHYLYATLDPWGGETLGCWESADFKQWTFAPLNWPTKAACTSPTSKQAMVWAPSVVKGKDGRFY